MLQPSELMTDNFFPQSFFHQNEKNPVKVNNADALNKTMLGVGVEVYVYMPSTVGPDVDGWGWCPGVTETSLLICEFSKRTYCEAFPLSLFRLLLFLTCILFAISLV